jgi:subtilase family serine protease
MRHLLGSAILLAALSAHGGASAAVSFTITGNTPRYALAARAAAAIDPAMSIDVTLWLKPHNRAQLDSIASQIYDRASPRYHQFLSRAALAQLVGPSDAEIASLTRFAESHGLTVVSKDGFNLLLRLRGTAGAIEQAFNTRLATVTVNGKTHRTNLNDPVIADPSGASVLAIEGLDDGAYAHHNLRPTAALPAADRAHADRASRDLGFSNVCFNGTTTINMATPSEGITASYTGNFYAKANGSCGYAPADIAAAYGLNAVYQAGYTGTGQTIVIVDWCGSQTIQHDANVFSTRFGLPALTASNFSIVDYPGQAECASVDPEINIDVEWAHAIAPGANLVLLVPPSAEFVDIDSALLYVVETGLGTITSNSYGAEESQVAPAILTAQNFVLEAGATTGISNFFSTGDAGDFTDDFFGVQPSVSTPASSPYAVAVGGVSLALTSAGQIQWQAGWGNNTDPLQESGVIYTAPPLGLYRGSFFGGSGGGDSAAFAKPAYQKRLSGTARRLPDIAWLADPFTGGIIAITEAGVEPSPVYTVYGGTSLACPMAAALWAIANQAAGGNLGFASPLLYAAPSGTITDITPVPSADNVSGSVTGNGQTYKQSVDYLSQPLRGTTKFLSAMWNDPASQETTIDITFGTDTTLRTARGWDNVTGLGVIDPAALITYAKTTP